VLIAHFSGGFLIRRVPNWRWESHSTYRAKIELDASDTEAEQRVIFSAMSASHLPRGGRRL
jgi:hypothetical protein